MSSLPQKSAPAVLSTSPETETTGTPQVKKRAISLKNILVGVVGGLFVINFATSFQWNDVISIIGRLDPWWFLVVAGACNIGHWSMRALRWRQLTRDVGFRGSFLEIYLANAAALALGAITPYQAGELLKIEAMKQPGIAFDRAPLYGLLIVEKCIDLATALLLASLILAWRLPKIAGMLSFDSNIVRITGIMMIAGLLGLTFFLRRFGQGKWKVLIAQSGIGSCRPSTLFFATVLSFLSWGFCAGAWQASLKSIGIQTTLWETLGMMVTVSVINVLSFVPGAVGVQETSISLILQQFGHRTAISQAGALVLRLLGLNIIVLGVVHFLIHRFIKERSSNSSQWSSK
jgi:uncharacterized membrane protein YbhN (UPF0104 family)